MKKLIVILSVFLVGCDSYSVVDNPNILIISSCRLNPGNTYSGKYRYEFNNLYYIILYSDSIYNVGDELKLTK